MISLLVVCFGLIQLAAGETCSVGAFTQTKTQADAKYLNCEHLQSSYGIGLDACKEVTCEMQGNGFNFRESTVFGTQCYVKKCCDGDVWGDIASGYDVYQFNGNCGAQADAPTADATSDADDTGEVTADGCKFRGATHPPGETWMQELNEGRHKECICPNPLPETWTAALYCRGACNVDGDPIYYAGQRYTIDGVSCRCNAYGRQRC